MSNLERTAVEILVRRIQIIKLHLVATLIRRELSLFSTFNDPSYQISIQLQIIKIVEKIEIGMRLFLWLLLVVVGLRDFVV